ncbi:hypothetical protein [Deinococcus multiflagellatus]|uniref:Uncharacterized protein n=1 Tax=Deinococcus multiflagellatus TaxID=1656887 RepID=A0ABW1ZSR4_9DEIO|nr:hypothetical protein [Deinococcus multiflagellatus]MBZ9713509.1 hypothetical protein [Deinococcus multiflagellatus]
MRGPCAEDPGRHWLAPRGWSRQRLVPNGRGRAVANAIACALHAWWCAHLGRPMRAGAARP